MKRLRWRAKGKKKKKKSDIADKLEIDKWGKEAEEEIMEDNAEENFAYSDHLCFEIGTDSDCVQDVLDYYLEEAGIELDAASEKELEQMEDRSKRVKVKRELGDWITCTVKNGKITCNCERYIYWRDCMHVVWMEVLHLNKLPPEDMQGATDNWVKIRERVLQLIKETYVSI
mmetsp:Transcript_13621/g.20507  ORF Transcript_13621/g.20507 Transcript_13621/m.20507 type:complete len:172 (+) Transcript_13621:2-517(+)